jgi:excisionase family DNA binding protein
MKKSINTDNPHKLLTMKQAAEYLAIPLPTIYYLVQRKIIHAVRIGGRLRIKTSCLEAIINRVEAESPATVTTEE